MLRISKLTDYGTVVMAYLANHPNKDHAAKKIAEDTHIALPTVSKLLKLFTRNGLLVAQRGVKGGYSLALPAQKISLAEIISALEGDIALTECGRTKSLCAMEAQCSIRSNWRMISEAIRDTLNKISLAQMISPHVKINKEMINF